MEELFGAPRALVGMIHLEALPGTPKGGLAVTEIIRKAVGEARLYRQAGFQGLMVENMHDRPYLKRTVGPEIVATVTAVVREIRRETEMPVGIQILAGANREALAAALASGAGFVRAEGFVFGHIADEGWMDSDAGELLRYRKAIGGEGIRVFVDIKKKHAAHATTADVDLVETAHAAELFLADGVVVTGAATGRPAAREEVRAVARAVSIPTLVGSGVTAENVGDFADADALIVGSWVKREGLWSNPPDPGRLEDLVTAFRDTSATDPARE